MNSKVQAVLYTLAIIFLTVLIYQWFFAGPGQDIDRIKKEYEARIDSLSQVIESRNLKIAEIDKRLLIFTARQDSLRDEVSKQIRLVKFYKGRGKFHYDLTTDDLHRELNTLVRQRLHDDPGTGDRVP